MLTRLDSWSTYDDPHADFYNTSVNDDVLLFPEHDSTYLFNCFDDETSSSSFSSSHSSESTHTVDPRNIYNMSFDCDEKAVDEEIVAPIATIPSNEEIFQDSTPKEEISPASLPKEVMVATCTFRSNPPPPPPRRDRFTASYQKTKDLLFQTQEKRRTNLTVLLARWQLKKSASPKTRRSTSRPSNRPHIATEIF